jgi:signal transduction histidine kinase
MADAAPENPSNALSVPWTDVVQFMRQLSHDLRNYLNAADLTAAYLNEVATEAEIKTEIKRLRDSIAAAAAALQKLSAAMGTPRIATIPYRVSEFIEDLRKKIASEFPDRATEIRWEIDATDGVLNVDPQLLQQAIIELFCNAFRHNRGEGPLIASGKIDNQLFVFTLREPKRSFDLPTENWGREPLHQVSPGHYGLGLNQVRAIIEAHGGDLHARYEPGESVLVTTIALPLSG